jgi:hypothetical protein
MEYIAILRAMECIPKDTYVVIESGSQDIARDGERMVGEETTTKR